MNPYLVERTIPRAGAASGLCRPSGLFAPLGMDSYFYSGCSENFIRNHSLVHFCDIFHSLRSWNISDNPLYFVIQRFASHDKIQWIIAGNDVNIFVSSVFNGEYYMKSNTKTGTRYFSQKQTMYKSSPFHGSKGHTGNLGPQSLKVGGQIV